MLLCVLGLWGLAHLRVSEGPITMGTLYNPDTACVLSLLNFIKDKFHVLSPYGYDAEWRLSLLAFSLCCLPFQDTE